MICPSCKGKGTSVAFVDWHDDSKEHGMDGELMELECHYCGGTGAIADVEAWRKREQRGRNMRNERKSKGESLRDAAKRMGISATKLSQIERGRLDS